MRLSPPRLAVVLGYALATIAFTWPLAAHISTHLTGDPGGDTGVYVWNQWVFHQELVAGHNPLTTARILSLTPPVDLSQHNYTPFLNLLALPLIPTFGVIASFNMVLLAICMLNALMTYGLARHVTPATRAEAWLAGLVFAWAPVMVARTTGHFSLVAAAALPAFLWCLVNAERSRSARDAALVGLCMAWAALSDAYFGIYCVVIAVLYLGTAVIRITRRDAATPRAWTWPLDVTIVCLGGLIVGLVLGRGGEFTVWGIPVHMRSLYNPVLILTLLVMARLVLWWRPRVERRLGPGRSGAAFAQGRPVWKPLLIAALACAGPLSPVLYGLGNRLLEGRFNSPAIFWRSSPRGVDVLSYFMPNPQHPIVRWLTEDALAVRPTHFVEYTASMSLVAIGAIGFAMWRANYRPAAGWMVLTIGFALLALGPFVYVAGVNTFVPGPWALLRYLPGLGLARMPTRFALIASLGVAVLFAGALAALSARWPHRRRLIVSVAALVLVCELWPAPRTLYSAEVSPIYARIASDPRPVRVLTLPFGVRDGTWETGNFRPRSLFNQTIHGKALIGGYLSRISPRRVKRMREQFPTLSALIELSEQKPLDPGVVQTLQERGDRLVRQSHLGYVVIDARFIPADRAKLVIDAFKLRELERDRHLTLFVPEATLAAQ